LEIVLLGMKSHSVYGRNPKSVTGIPIQALYLIVGKSELVTCTEMLLVFINVEPVQPSEGCDPYMPVRIFSEGSDLLV
jgi:hypothetical protein